MDAIEAMTVLRNRRILSVFAAVSYPRQYCNIYGICLYNNYVFWYECKNFLEEGLGTAVDDRILADSLVWG